MPAKIIQNLTVLSLLALPAYGYTDPGSGLMLWQILGAVFVGIMFYARKALRVILPGKRKTATKTDPHAEPDFDSHA